MPKVVAEIRMMNFTYPFFMGVPGGFRSLNLGELFGALAAADSAKPLSYPSPSLKLSSAAF